MLTAESRETLLYRVALPPGDHVGIYSGDPPEPLPADWVGITRVQAFGRETFILYFFTTTGEPLEFLQFETLRIALDQGWDLTGIPPAQWERCNIDLGTEWEAIPWSGPRPS